MGVVLRTKMKSTNSVILSIYLILWIISTCLQIYFNKCLQTECDNIRKKIECDWFISESFRYACESENSYSLIEWQKMCSNIWQLDYIGWGNASDFLNNDNLIYTNTKLLYGKWISSFGEGEVYCRIK